MRWELPAIAHKQAATAAPPVIRPAATFPRGGKGFILTFSITPKGRRRGSPAAALLWVSYASNLVEVGVNGTVILGLAAGVGAGLGTGLLALCLGAAGLTLPQLWEGVLQPDSIPGRILFHVRLPRVLTLAMLITFTFFPLLRAEVRQTREAMRTRGAGGLLNPAILYRAFLIPLMVRLVNLSDTLALSVETRGFTTYPAPYTVYRPVYLQAKDGAFAALSALCAMGAVLL